MHKVQNQIKKKNAQVIIIKEHSQDFSPLNKAQHFTIHRNENLVSFPKQKKSQKLALCAAFSPDVRRMALQLKKIRNFTE